MSDTTRAATNPLWDFSLAIYSSKEVQAACLELQDGSGVDVNAMLYVLWLASLGRKLDTAAVRQVLDTFDPWRAEVVVPLRVARRALREPAAVIDAEGAASLRAQVKKVELEAERLQQWALWSHRKPETLGAAEPASRDVAAANLAAYGAALGRQLAAGPVDVMLSAFERQVRPI